MIEVDINFGSCAQVVPGAATGVNLGSVPTLQGLSKVHTGPVLPLIGKHETMAGNTT
jgi:hypothetical protein